MSSRRPRWSCGLQAGASLLSLLLLAGMAAPAAAQCVSSDTRLCLLGGRFGVEGAWQDTRGAGVIKVAPFTSSDSGLLYFYGPDNWEILIKVIDGCSSNGRFWVYFATTTSLSFQLTVRDYVSGASKLYTNVLGAPAPAVTDTDAFRTCP